MPRLSSKPTVMFLLQNQWFPDPDRARKVLSLYEDRKGEEAGWNRFVRDMLFLGCLTGRRIEAAFGEDLCWDAVVGEYEVTTVFEETSREIGDKPSSVFPPDRDHLVASFRRHRPDCIVAFGAVAAAALELGEPVAELPAGCKIIRTCHPAARGPDTIRRLAEASVDLREWIKEHS